MNGEETGSLFRSTMPIRITVCAGDYRWEGFQTAIVVIRFRSLFYSCQIYFWISRFLAIFETDHLSLRSPLHVSLTIAHNIHWNDWKDAMMKIRHASSSNRRVIRQLAHCTQHRSICKATAAKFLYKTTSKLFRTAAAQPKEIAESLSFVCWFILSFMFSQKYFQVAAFGFSCIDWTEKRGPYSCTEQFITNEMH